MSADDVEWVPLQQRTFKLETDGTEAARIANMQSWARQCHYEAPPSPEGAAVNQDLSDLPNLFPGYNDRRAVCGVCDVPLTKNSMCVALTPIQCYECKISFHYKCENLERRPRYPQFWLCSGCRSVCPHDKCSGECHLYSSFQMHSNEWEGGMLDEAKAGLNRSYTSCSPRKGHR